MAIQKGAAGYSSRPLHSQITMAKITILDACWVDGKSVSVGDVIDVPQQASSYRQHAGLERLTRLRAALGHAPWKRVART